QLVSGNRKAVDAGYALSTSGQVYFQLGDYAAGEPLVIDPVLTYSTFLGGSFVDEGDAIALDDSGNIYVTGFTTSSNFPKAHPFQSEYGTAGDAFVTKLNAEGSALVFSTYLGGNDIDHGYGIALDGSRNVYITGSTYSTDFPLFNPLQPTHHGFVD